MKTIICTKYGEPEVLQLKEIDKPVPKDNEILVKLYATAVTSSDTYIRRLHILPLYMQIMAGLFVGFGKPRNPILGMIVSGEVEETGANVTRFKKGDQVFGTTVLGGMNMNFGTYAEYKCLPERSYISHKPSNLNFLETAAIVYGGGMAMWCIDKTGFPRQSEKSAESLKVLVYGASGSVGTSLVQIAKVFGAEVTGVCSTSNFDLVRSLGATQIIDYNKDDFTARGETWDFIFDAVGYKKSGTYCKNYRQALTTKGKFHSVDDGSPKNSVEHIDCIRNLAERGLLKPVIDRVYTLEQIVEAHRYVDQGHKKGNVIITI
jgi:NADPH:quinone reductase-like Zn-dependent oxidoreductase